MIVLISNKKLLTHINCTGVVLKDIPVFFCKIKLQNYVN